MVDIKYADQLIPNRPRYRSDEYALAHARSQKESLPNSNKTNYPELHNKTNSINKAQAAE